MKKFLMCLCLTFLVWTPGAASAEFGNGGFETGDFTNWETVGDASIETETFGSGPPYGAYQALITTGSGAASADALRLFVEPSELTIHDDVIEGSAIKQTFSGNAGEIFVFKWNLLTNSDELVSYPWHERTLGSSAYLHVGSTGGQISYDLSGVNTQDLSDSQTEFLKETGFEHTWSNELRFIIPWDDTYTFFFTITDRKIDGVHGLLIDYRPPIRATVDIEPNVLNYVENIYTLEVKTGKWISCYIELPEGYELDQIDVSTIRLFVGVKCGIANSLRPVPSKMNVGDYDKDGIPDLMVKFYREIIYWNSCFGLDLMTLHGRLIDDEGEFQGTDEVEVRVHYKMKDK